VQLRPTPRTRLLHILTFDVPIKYLCGPTLLSLSVIQAVADATKYDHGYLDRPKWLQCIAAIFVIGLMFGTLLVIGVYPDFWDNFGVDENAGQQVAIYEEQQVRSLPVMPAVPCSVVPAVPLLEAVV
jgi:hypothetical protein